MKVRDDKIFQNLGFSLYNSDPLCCYQSNSTFSSDSGSVQPKTYDPNVVRFFS